MGDIASTIELVTTLRARGVRFQRAGAQLRCTAPRGVLTDAVKAAITAHKPEIIALISNDIPEPTPLPRATVLRMASRKCAGCGNLTIARHGTPCARCRRERARWN